MVQNRNPSRRPPGRPQIRSDEATRDLIVAAADDEFQAKGYASTGMSAVAERAGVSTKTLYRLIPTKEELFKSVVSRRIGRFMLEIDQAVEGSRDMPTALEQILLAYGNLVLSKEVIGVTRLVLAEGPRFPEIAAAFYENAVRRTGEAMERWLRRQCERGLVALEDPQAATGMLRGMMAMEPQRAAMLGQSAPPDAAAIARRARLCARLFLDGCARTEDAGDPPAETRHLPCPPPRPD